jgi:hypothetical protein
MNILRANIWSYHPEHWIVIPTNIGWKKNGENVMGRGLAQQAAAKFPGLASWYGQVCRDDAPRTWVKMCIKHSLLMFPVKPLGADPSMAWKQKAALDLIEHSARQLRNIIWNYAMKVVMPMVGCGNGGLRREEVLPILEKHLGDLPNLTIVDLT